MSWALDIIGNWQSREIDLIGDGQYQAASDRIIAGDFNDCALPRCIDSFLQEQPL